MSDRKPEGEGSQRREWRAGRPAPGARGEGATWNPGGGGAGGDGTSDEATGSEDVKPPRIPERRLGRVPVTTVDGGVGLAAWIGAAIFYSQASGSGDAELRFYVYGLLALPTFTLLWFALRLFPTIARLAGREFRENLAATPISARAFLTANLLPDALRAGLPLLALLPVFGLVSAFTRFPLDPGGLFSVAVVVLEYAALALAMLAHAGSGALDFLMRLCERPRDSGISLLRFFGWNLLSLPPVFFVLWFGIYPVLALVVACGVLAHCLDGFFKRLKRASAAYFRFDDAPDPRDGPRRITPTERGVRPNRMYR